MTKTEVANSQARNRKQRIRDLTVECQMADGSVRMPGIELDKHDPRELQTVRQFAFYRGQRRNPGWYWSKTTETLIPYESRLEYITLLDLDFDPDVEWITGQPFKLSWRFGGRRHRHVPDFLLVRGSGGCEIRNVSRPEVAAREEVAIKHRACEALANSLRWTASVTSEVAEQRVMNLKFLSGFRRRHLGLDEVRPNALAIARNPIAFGELVSSLADFEYARPSVLHLIWTGELKADIDQQITDQTVVEAKK